MRRAELLATQAGAPTLTRFASLTTLSRQAGEGYTSEIAREDPNHA
jgi:hypothetical protein